MTKKHEQMNIRGGYSNSTLLTRLFVMLLMCVTMLCGALFAVFNFNKKADAFTISEYKYGLVSTDDLYNGNGGVGFRGLNALSANIFGNGKNSADFIATAMKAGTAGGGGAPKKKNFF